VLEVFTDQPGLQFYCGNFFDGSYCGKIEGLPIGYREALALETQKFPDGVNKPHFPDTILRPGETYTQTSVYKFSTR
jgi:aldose 1-epimerase